MNLKRCNGCGVELRGENDALSRNFNGQTRNPRVVIEGRRVDDLSGTLGEFTLVRDGEEFHWCMKCAMIAFKAVEIAAASRG